MSLVSFVWFYHQCFYNCLLVCFFVFLLFLYRRWLNVDMKIVLVSLLATNKIRYCIMDRFGLVADYQRPFWITCSSPVNNPKLALAFNKTRGTHVPCLHPVIRENFAFDSSIEQTFWVWIQKGLVFRGIYLLTVLCQKYFVLIVCITVTALSELISRQS